MAVFLVRHAKTVVRPDVDASQWELDPRDLEQLRTMGSLLPSHDNAHWFSSAETKARQTAAALTSVDVAVVEDLGEVRRGGFDPHYQDTVSRFFAKPTQAASVGWETAAQAESRFLNTVHTLIAEHDESADIVIVSHGLVMTLLRSKSMPGTNPVDMWAEQSCPDIYCLPTDSHQQWRKDPDHMEPWERVAFRG